MKEGADNFIILVEKYMLMNEERIIVGQTNYN
mgnify:CR=1 FL=1